jgi:hypothetical protein
MALPNVVSLRPGFLWLTLNLDLIIRCLSRNTIFFFFSNFTYAVNVFAYLLGCLRVPQVEDHCSRL